MPSVAQFLIERLENAGVGHVFGVPGDYSLPIFQSLLSSKKIKLINNSDETAAGFAADGYARANGIGCVCVTYAVGALKLLNSTACSDEERAPVIVISGSPGIKERGNVRLHHSIGESVDTQRRMFAEVTAAQAILSNPVTAAYEIDRVIEVLKTTKRPVYIELPRDISKLPIDYDVYIQGTPSSPISDPFNLEDALLETVNKLKNAKNPVVLAGVEVARCKIGKELVKFIEKYNIPVACTLLSKSVINETHPLYIGVYAGSNSSQQHVKDMVENSDCLLVCGEILTEATAGYRPSKIFQKREMISCTIEELKISNHTYPNVLFTDFCNSLFKKDIGCKYNPVIPEKKTLEKFTPQPDTKLKVNRLFEKINSILDENTVVVADVGDCLFGSADFTVRHSGCFYASATYLSMGYAIPAALGIKLAKPNVKPIILVGDGAFQMSCSELGVFVKNNVNAVVIVINNKGYLTERIILDGSFNDIPEWNYHNFASVVGGNSYLVENEVDLDSALTSGMKSKGLTILNCSIDKFDFSPALERVSKSLSKKVNKD